MARYRVAGRDFACHFCDGTEFAERKVKLNTGAMSFFDLDWLNKSADGLICEGCGYVHMFLKKDAVQPA
ncbi:MAG TPA: hypothetical protein VFZ37_08315 [Jiangellaceae bacterium]